MPPLPPLVRLAALPALAVTHDQLLEQVVILCRQLRLYHYHAADSSRDFRHSMSGFPDLVIAGRRVLHRELKTGAADLEPDQKRWRRRLELAGADYAVWRPADYDSGLVLEQLLAIT